MDGYSKLQTFGGKGSKLVFYVNGTKIEVEAPSPETTLVQYLRRTLILPGTKKAFGQGGCGACTAMVSWYDWINKKIIHLTVNACITPICYLHGMAITTVEGVGGTRNGLHPIQKSLVESHGFCTPGMVMSMYTLFHNIPQPTPEQMERAIEGNLCRCTGYRPIVDAFRKASKECPCGLGLCNQTSTDDPTATATQALEKLTKDNAQHLIFPPDLQGIVEPPFLLAISVHTALQEAVISARKDAGAECHYQLPCPATVDRIRMACCDKLLQKCDKIVGQSSQSTEILL